MFFLFFFLCCPSFLQAQEKKETPLIQEVSFENFAKIHFDQEPSLYVEGVNIITGEYTTSSEDIVIQGIEPLQIQRFYGSNNLLKGNLGRQWHLNHGGFFHPAPANVSNAIAEGSFGSVTLFKSKGKENLQGQKWKFALSKMRKGLTNVGSGIISGRTNRKNEWVQVNHDQRKCQVFLANGSIRHHQFKKGEMLDHQLKNAYPLREEKKLRGVKYCYQYEKSGNISKVLLQDQNQKEMAWADFRYKSNGNIELTTSDGRKVIYETENYLHYVGPDNFWDFDAFFQEKAASKPGDLSPPKSLWQQGLYVTSVYGTGTVSKRYKYKKLKNDNHTERKLKKIFVDGKCQCKINYYEDGSKSFFENNQPVEKGDSIYGKVKNLLKAHPYNRGFFFISHQFFYNAKKRYTLVKDAHNFETKYYFSKNHQLEKVVQFDAENPYKANVYVWGEEKTFDDCNLLEHRIEDGKGTCIGKKSFTYDSFGNVIKEKLEGDLKGDGKKSSYEIHFEYSQDGKNLLLRKTTAYSELIFSYIPETDLLEKRLLKVKGEIFQREFFFYNPSSALIQKVIDDGNTEDFKDLSHVTERHIIKYEPYDTIPFFGLPKVEEAYAYDFNLNKEKLLNRLEKKYDNQGNCIQQKIFNGEQKELYTLFFSYDEFGNCTKEINALGLVTTKKYDTKNHLIEEKGPSPGFSIQYSYDFLDNCIKKEQFSFGKSIKIEKAEFTPRGECRCRIGDLGDKTLFGYDFARRLVQSFQNHALFEKKEFFTHDLLGFVTSQKTNDIQGVKKAYTVRGKESLVEYQDGTSEKYLYEEEGKLMSHVSRGGVTTSYVYDSFGRVIEKRIEGEDGRSKVFHFSYSAFHLLEEIDEEGISTYYTYDFRGFLIKKIRDKQTITYDYDDLGNCISICNWINDHQFIAEKKVYDFLGQVTQSWVEDEKGRKSYFSKFFYNEKGKLTETHSEKEGKLAIFKTFYNNLNEITDTIDEEENRTHIDYELTLADGQNGFYYKKITVTDPTGTRSITYLNHLGKEVKKETISSFGFLLQEREFFYNAFDQITKIIDHVHFQEKIENQTETLFIYNEMQERVEVIQAFGTHEETHYTTKYNSLGLKETETRPNGVSIHYQYDSLGSLIEVFSSDQTIHYHYQNDVKGRIIFAKDEINQKRFYRTYSSKGDIIEEITDSFVTSYAYDPLDRILHVTIPDGSSWRYTYDGNFISSLTRKDEGENFLYTIGYEYDSYGRLTKKLLPDSCSEIVYSYTEKNQIKKITHPKFQETITYNNLDDITHRSYFHEEKETSFSYEFDGLRQIIKENNFSYEYDSLYNRRRKNEDLASFNSLQEILSQGNIRLSYDQNGNLTKKEDEKSSLFHYDAFDRLTSVQIDNKIYQYVYDPFGRRISKITDNQEISYWYLAEQEIASVSNGQVNEIRILEKSSAKEGSATVSFEIKDEIYFPIYDASARISSLLNRNGNLVETYFWSVFGEEILTGSHSTPLPWHWVGKRQDPETQFLYFGKRFYDPVLGRWITQDPLQPIDSLNFYHYAHNNSLVFIDFLGLTGTSLTPSPIDRVSRGQPFDFAKPALWAFDYGVVQPIGQTLAAFQGIPYENSRFEQFSNNKSRLIEVSSDPNYQNKTPWKVIYFVNGINNGENDAIQSALHLSQLAGGHPVRCVYNASHTLPIDIYESIQHFTRNTATPSALLIREDLRKQSEQEGFEAYIYCHSQGTAHTSYALILSKTEVRQHVEVAAYSPSLYIDHNHCKTVTHYCNRWDPISWLHIRGWVGQKDTIVTLPGSDHCFDCVAYETFKRRGVTNFLSNE